MRPTGISLCSGGVDGLGIAFEVAGFNVSHYVEYDAYCAANLRRLHPSALVIEDDIRNVATLPTADVVFGGPPCQGFSVAGKQLGLADDRYLWPEMFRLVRTIQPRVVLVENVRGAASGGLIDAVSGDLEAEGYTCGTFLLPACLFGAPHERYRICIVAHAQRVGQSRSSAGEKNHSNEERNLSGDQQTRWANADAYLPGGQNVGNAHQVSLQSHSALRQTGTSSRREDGQFKRPSRRSSQHRHLYQSKLGRAADRSARWLDGLEPTRDFPGWPAGQGTYQHSYEPSRTLKTTGAFHEQRVQAIGNAVIWQQFLPFAKAIYAWLAAEGK